MDEDKVFVGDYLGTIEEYVPGLGTYVEEGRIYASNNGVKMVDNEKRTVSVGGGQPEEIHEGQIVFGEVLKSGKNMVIVIVSRIKGVNRLVDVKTSIYVSNISKGYIENVDDAFGVGDIVKGKVLKIDQNLIDLTTKDDDLGVVKAFCKQCRHPLVKSAKAEGKLECPSCSHIESRKISTEYNNVADI